MVARLNNWSTNFSPVETDGEECEDIQGDAEEGHEVVDFAQNCSEYPDSEASGRD